MDWWNTPQAYNYCGQWCFSKKIKELKQILSNNEKKKSSVGEYKKNVRILHSNFKKIPFFKEIRAESSASIYLVSEEDACVLQLVSPLCLKILNNSALSYCSPQLLLSLWSPRVEGNNRSIHRRMYAQRQRVPACYVASCFLSHMLCHTRGIACVRPSFPFFFFFGQAAPFFIVVPSPSPRRSSRGWTLRGAAVWCAIRGLEPWSRGEAVHNSHGLNLLSFITQTVLDSPHYFFFLFPQTSRKEYSRVLLMLKFSWCCDCLIFQWLSKVGDFFYCTS